MSADGNQSRSRSQTKGQRHSKFMVAAGGAMIVLTGVLIARLAGDPPSLDIAPAAPARDGASVGEVAVDESSPSALRDEGGDADNLGPMQTVEPTPAADDGLVERVVSHFVRTDKTSGDSGDRCEQIRRVAEASCRKQLFADQGGPTEQCIARELRYTLWSIYGCR